MRLEKDSLGEMEVPDDAIYGIHSLRSYLNFVRSGEKINPVFIKSFFLVKKAAAEANFKGGQLDKEKYDYIVEAIDYLVDETEKAIANNSNSIYSKVIVDPFQGGAGTSLNMNINEVIANTALLLSGRKLGDYDFINPLDDVNLSQSTNDTYPTAFKVASIYLIRELAEAYAYLQKAFQTKEEEFKDVLKLGRTQMQDAVPITLGEEFGAYAQAIARDRWRLYNGEERLRSINLGGTAIGTSVNANKNFVLTVANILKNLTGLPIAKAEDLVDSTQNLDAFAEVHGLIKSGALSLIKICNDLRFLSSGPKGGIGEILLPPMQAGSSIMPGKVNPVILEHVIQISELVKGHDVVLCNLISAGNLELNPFTPMIAHKFLKSLQLLKDALYIFADKCIAGIKADEIKCKEHLINSSALAAFLINANGYDAVAEVVKSSLKDKVTFIDALEKSNLENKEEVLNLFKKDILDE